VTPFELTQAIRAGGLKILKKTKYFIPAKEQLLINIVILVIG